MFVVIEGINGVGKSTQCDLVSNRLPNAVTFRDPGSTPLGERLRPVLKDQSLEVTEEALTLLFMSSRVELFHREIIPALDKGMVVIMDRWFHSTVAYQGCKGVSVNDIESLGRWVHVDPELTCNILLMIDPEKSLERAQRLSNDRYEQDGISLQRSLQHAYEAQDWDAMIDTTNLSPEEVTEEILKAIRGGWHERPNYEQKTSSGLSR